jgi:hypothetical protein
MRIMYMNTITYINVARKYKTLVSIRRTETSWLNVFPRFGSSVDEHTPIIFCFN